MADNRPNEMSSSSSPTTSSSSPMMEPNGTPNGNDSKANTPTNKDPLNAPKFGTLVPNRIFVGGIPTDTKESEVEHLFAKFGKVTSVKIINDRAGVPRGYGFVTFDTEEDANKVIKESENLLLKNRKLNVSVAIKKNQNQYNNEFTSRSFPNGSIIYNGFSPYLASNAMYPDFNVYTSDAIQLYNMGVNPQLMANSPITSPSGPYPYTYHASGLYLSTQPSMNPQMTAQYQNTASTYPTLVNTSFARMPITSQNVNQMNPYLQLSNTTPPPMSQSSSMPMQPMAPVGNPHMASDSMSNAINAVNVGMSSLGLGQTPVYAIPSNMANGSQPIALNCVSNVQLKADNGIDMCSDNSHLLSAPVSTQQMFELVPVWPQRMANVQSPNKPAMNRNQYPSKGPAFAVQETPNERADRRSYSSSNASHNRKSTMGNSVNRSKPNGYGYGYNRNTNVSAAETQCQTVQNHNSIPNPSAFQGMPFVKHQSNNRYHTIPFASTQPPLTASQPSIPKINGTIGPPHRITKVVNGVEIFAVPNMSAGEPDYGYLNHRTSPAMTGVGQRRCHNSSQK